MKKLFLLLFILGTAQFALQAQNKADRVVVLNEAQALSAKQAIENSLLDKQLTSLFGDNYAITNAKVIAHLNKNVTDTKATYELRKLSLIALYGDKAGEHADLIRK